MNEFKNVEIVHDTETETIYEPFDLTEERHEELIEGAEKRLQKIQDEKGGVSQVIVIEEFTRDCKNINEVALMGYHAGVLTEKNNNPMSRIMAAMGGLDEE